MSAEPAAVPQTRPGVREPQVATWCADICSVKPGAPKGTAGKLRQGVVTSRAAIACLLPGVRNAISCVATSARCYQCCRLWALDINSHLHLVGQHMSQAYSKRTTPQCPVQEESEQHGEIWGESYRDIHVPSAFPGDLRAAMAPFLANASLGRAILRIHHEVSAISICGWLQM